MQHSPDVIQRFARSFILSDKNADMNNWEWNTKSKAPWKLAEENWQHFLAKWYGAESQSALLVNPKSLSLEHLPDHIPSNTSAIFIRKSYETLFDAVWTQAVAMQGRNGVIITGQPGIGKTLFNYYLLVRLLQRKQVILFSPEGKAVYLFYLNKVYTVGVEALAAEGLDVSIPNPKSSSKVFIWSLFDICDRKEPERFLVNYPCFPVQIASPDPSCYKSWDKRQLPLHTGLPLWTREELAQGLRYQNQYIPLLKDLCKVYGSFPTDMSALVQHYPGTRELLEDRYSGEGTVPPSPEDTLDYLLDAAIERFGRSARDVFSAVFNYSEVTRLHQDAFDIKYEDLQVAASALSKSRSVTGINEPHRILAISPVNQKPFENVRWNVDFKSNWIARNVMQNLIEAEDAKIHQQVRLFANIPEARGMMDRLLEPLAHRYIANTTTGFWPLIPMFSNNNTDAPNFNLARDSPIPKYVRFSKVKRKIVMLQSTTALSACLENNGYYIPPDSISPLFDSFTIELDLDKKRAILWVLRMTTSGMHEGSLIGYQRIRDIIGVINDKLQESTRPRKKRKIVAASPTPHVEVRYVLVAPKDESQSQNLTLQWQFPKGWSHNREKRDHCGDVYCLEIPFPVQRIYFGNVCVLLPPTPSTRLSTDDPPLLSYMK